MKNISAFLYLNILLISLINRQRRYYNFLYMSSDLHIKKCMIYSNIVHFLICIMRRCMQIHERHHILKKSIL